jgi:hypothetical protein
MEEFLAAIRAGDLKIGTKQPAFAAGEASAAQVLADGLTYIAGVVGVFSLMRM